MKHAADAGRSGEKTDHNCGVRFLPQRAAGKNVPKKKKAEWDHTSLHRELRVGGTGNSEDLGI